MILVHGIDCASRRLSLVRRDAPDARDDATERRLQELAASFDLQLGWESEPATGHTAAVALATERHVHVVCALEDGTPVYRLQCAHRLENLRPINALLGAILATSSLQTERVPCNVAVYELVANSLEHGRRGGSPPEGDDALCLEIRVGRDRITGFVADRCDPFDPFLPQNLARSQRSVRQKGRRGYGLRMVRHILDDFRYRRVEDGNVFLFAKDVPR